MLHPLQHRVLRGVVRFVFTRDLEHRRDGPVVLVHQVPYAVRGELRYEHHRDVLPRSHLLERVLDLLRRGLVGNDEVIRLASQIDVPDAREEKAGDGVLVADYRHERALALGRHAAFRRHGYVSEPDLAMRTARPRVLHLKGRPSQT